LAAAPIDHLGATSARRLGESFESVDALVNAGSSCGPAAGLSSRALAGLEAFLTDTRAVDSLRDAEAAMRHLLQQLPADGDAQASHLPLEGHTVVLTGSLDTMTRNQARS